VFINGRVERAWNVLVFLAQYEEKHKGQKACAKAVQEAIGIGRTDDIWKTLLKGNLIASTRGSGGGYALAKPPQSIHLAMVSLAVCTDRPSAEGAFAVVAKHMRQRGERITLEDFLPDEGD
jgi:DNA-binding IscR family transcriptional regulator